MVKVKAVDISDLVSVDFCFNHPMVKVKAAFVINAERQALVSTTLW